MASRNIILSLGAMLSLAAQSGTAKPVIPNPETPPVTLAFSSTYYTNVAGSSAALAAARGLKRVDEVYAPAINLNFVEPIGGASLFLAGQAGYDIHQRNSILDRERIALQGGADAQVSVCETTAVGSFARYQSDVADLSIVATKNTQELTSAELDATCNQSGRIVPSASISHSWSDNSAFQYKSQNYESTAASGSVLYKAGALGSFSLVGQYTRTDYPNRFFLLGPTVQNDGYSLYSGGIHYERTIGTDVDFGASVNETSLSTDNSFGSNFDGITYDATIAYHPTSRLNFNAEASRQTLPSNYLDAAYSIVETYTAGVDYRLSARMTAKVGAIQTHSNLEGGALRPGIDLTVQTYRTFYGSLAYTISPTMSATLTAGQAQRHADVASYSYSGAQLGLTLSKAF